MKNDKGNLDQSKSVSVAPDDSRDSEKERPLPRLTVAPFINPNAWGIVTAEVPPRLIGELPNQEDALRYARLFAAAPDLIDENARLRKLLWAAHAVGDGGYGDDGELQWRGVDFKRGPISQIEELIEFRNMEKLARAAHTASPRDPTEAPKPADNLQVDPEKGTA